jgi:hypothetical protein
MDEELFKLYLAIYPVVLADGLPPGARYVPLEEETVRISMILAKASLMALKQVKEEGE